MPLTYHLIDGYNLLHAAGLARETYGPGDYERARFALLVRIAEGLDDASRERTTVVFDAFEPPDDAVSRFRFRELTVEFSVESGDADTRIEQLIRRHASPRQLRVVSDDIRLKQAAKRRGAAAVGCEAFLRRLARFKSRGGGSADRLSTPTDDAAVNTTATGDWLDYFGIADGDAARPVETSPMARGLSPTTPAPPTSSQPAGPVSSSKPSSKSSSKSKSKQSKAHGNPPRDAAVPLPSDDRAVEDLAFWQQRIEDALAEEQPPHNQRRESS